MKKGAFLKGVNILDSNPKAYKQVKKKYKMQNKGGLIKKGDEGLKLQQQQSNYRNREIARQLVKTPTPGNLFKALYHWWNGTPYLGGELENGKIMVTGITPTPGISNAKDILSKTNSIKALIPKYNKFAKYYGYDIIPDGTSIDDAEKLIKTGLDRHNTFYRGITMPEEQDVVAIKNIIGKNATDREVLEYLIRKGSRNPNNTYLSPDARSAFYAKDGDIAILKRKYKLGDNPENWLKDADFKYDTTPATKLAPENTVNYPWAGSFIEKAPPGEVRIHPNNYTFEGWLPKELKDFGDIKYYYVKPDNFKGSKNLWFNEEQGHIKPIFKQGGLIKKAEEGTKLNGWQKLGNFLNGNKTLLNGIINGISTIGNSIKTTNYSNEFDQVTDAQIKAMQEQAYNEKYKEGLQLAPMILQSDGNVNYSNIDYQQFAKQYAEGDTDLSAIAKFKMDRLNEKQKQINAIQGSSSNLGNYIQQGLESVLPWINKKFSTQQTTISGEATN